MSAKLECRNCGTFLPLTGPRVRCHECGKEYDGLPLPYRPEPTSTARADRTEKEEQRDGWRLMKSVRPDAMIYDTSQPQQAKITPGLPDWLVFSPQEGFFFFEWKRPGGKLTDQQQRFREWCEQCEIPYYFGDVSDLAKAIGLIHE